MRKLLCILLTVILSGTVYTSQSTTITVGEGKQYSELTAVEDLVEPGDTVEVDGGAVYEAGAYFSNNGTADQWIVLRGIRADRESRPEISGSGTYGVNISADYVILEGFHVTGMAKGIGVFGDNIVVRDCIISECNHGLIGYGTGTGNVTVEYCEFFGNGVPTGGATQHQIYMATDEDAHPGSVFRLQFCYLHDGVEGDNVKSRSERNEIYFNWIEEAGSSGHGLGLFAPDPEDNDRVSIDTRREDADVVGNVIMQSHNSCARIGGDAPGYPTNGRYRFVNNTFILTGSRGDVIRTFNTIETLEMYNNVMYSSDSDADIRVINDADGEWVHNPRTLIGSNNWVSEHATRLPTDDEWSATLSGDASPFTDADNRDFTPAAQSPCIDAGSASTPTVTEYPLANTLFPPAFLPSPPLLMEVGTAQSRPEDEHIDIGAFEAAAQQVINRHLINRYDATYQSRLPEGRFSINGRTLRSDFSSAAGMWLSRWRREGGKAVVKRVLVKE